MRKPRTQPGFTLVEFLVVVAIVLFLAALLFPAISITKSRAHSTLCKSNLRQMGVALQLYLHEHNRYPYLRSLPDPEDTEEPAAARNNRWWWAKLDSYYPLRWNDSRYHCPAYKGAITGSGNGHDPLGSYAYNARGVRPPFAAWQLSVTNRSMRYTGALGLGPTLYASSPGNPRPAIAEHQVRVPSQMFAVGESRFLSAKVNGIPGGYCDMTCGILAWKVGRGPMEFAFDPVRHGRYYNQLFCDGHVAPMNPWILFNPTNTAKMWNYDNAPHQELWPPE